LRIEIAGGFIGQNDRRVVRQDVRDRDALALAAGQFVRLVMHLNTVFPINVHFPKLDVAGSIPVSRSLKSATWKVLFTVLHQNYIIKENSIHKGGFKLFDSPQPVFRAMFR